MKHAQIGAGVSLVAGAMFGVGLLVSGMTKPRKVLGFLDVTGAWDASLLLVMVGAITVHFFANRLIRRRATPLYAEKFELPARRDLDLKLVAGAALFGVGWGLGGYCPGPALVSLASGGAGVAVFVSSMLLGLWFAARLESSGYGQTEGEARAPTR